MKIFINFEKIIKNTSIQHHPLTSSQKSLNYFSGKFHKFMVNHVQKFIDNFRVGIKSVQLDPWVILFEKKLIQVPFDNRDFLKIIERFFGQNFQNLLIGFPVGKTGF